MSSKIYDESKFPHTYSEMIELSGINSLFYDEDFEEWSKVDPKTIIEVLDFVENVSLDIEIQCVFIDSLIIQFQFATRAIKIERFVSTGIRRGVAARCLKAQELVAKGMGYKLIHLLAYKNQLPFKSPHSKRRYDWTGYIVWGKLGFLFLLPEDQDRFDEVVKGYDRHITMLHKLLKDESGSNFWSKKGFEWYGIFQIGPGTQSSGILNNYLRKIGY